MPCCPSSSGQPVPTIRTSRLDLIPPTPPTPKPIPTPARKPIEDTWHLLAFGNVSAGASESLDTAIYALTFRPDGTVYGRDANGRYTLNRDKLSITLDDIDEATLPDFSRRLRRALRRIERFELDTAYHSLRITYAGGRRYLYFSNLSIDPTPTPRPEQPVSSYLLHHWQLAGFGRSSDGSLTPVKPQDDRFSLIFLEERKWTGRTSEQRLSGTFRSGAPFVKLTFDTPAPATSEDALGRSYIDALQQVEWYRPSLHQDTLRLYYGDDDQYLLFINPDAFMPGPFSDRLLNAWKLVAFGRTADGSERQPKDPDYYSGEKSRRFMLFFHSNGQMGINSSTNFGDGRFIANGQRIRIKYLGGTLAGEMKDGEVFLNAIDRSERFELTPAGQLKIIYNEGRSYLRFRAAPELVIKDIRAAVRRRR